MLDQRITDTLASWAEDCGPHPDDDCIQRAADLLARIPEHVDADVDLDAIGGLAITTHHGPWRIWLSVLNGCEPSMLLARDDYATIELCTTALPIVVWGSDQVLLAWNGEREYLEVAATHDGHVEWVWRDRRTDVVDGGEGDELPDEFRARLERWSQAGNVSSLD